MPELLIIAGCLAGYFAIMWLVDRYGLTERERAKQHTVQWMKEYWGERCPDFEPNCYCCKAWAAYDIVFDERN